jgi:N-acetylglucosaminyldiphosphoundecaprenol N-acetyl-beta-D-mannosaminyltransferase
MYLRYGDPSWDAAEASADAPPVESSRGNNGTPSGSPSLKRKSPEPGRKYPRVTLAGVKLDAISEKQCIAHVLDEIGAGRGGMLVTPNLDHLHRCSTNLAFSALVAEADLVVADGMPLVWASRLQGTPLPERVAGSNLITTLSGAAAERGRSIYLLGGSEGTAEGAARVLTSKYPGLKVAGTWYPPMGFENDTKHMAEMVQNLSSAHPDIVYVALGSPKQEKLIARLRPILPSAWWVGVGNSFSFLCGDVRRAPRWMQKCGLEWTHRLFQEPKRLFKRYIVVGVPFASGLLAKSLVRGIPNRLRRRGGAGMSGPTQPNKHNGHGEAHTLVVDPIQFTPPPSLNSPTRNEPNLAAVPGEAQAIAEATVTITEGDPQRAAAMSLSRLRALVLLGGAVRPSPLSLQSGRSLLDLPVDDSGSVLSHWIDQAAELARSIGLERLPVRVMVSANTPEPTSLGTKHYGAFRVERDASDYRGTGGVLRDLAQDYEDDDLILVANAAQLLLDPLPTIIAAMARKACDVSVISHEDGTPSGLMLVACKTLRSIADTGYVDMKEQALPQIALSFDVRVVRRRRPTGLPIRTLEDYVQALRLHHRRRQGKPFVADPLAEDWSAAFALVEHGATVDPSARIHDSIVMSGGLVEPGAVLVRSIVCAGEVVRRDKTVVDQLVCTDDGRTRRLSMQRGFEVIQKTVSAAAAV